MRPPARTQVLLLVNRLTLGGPLIHACMLARELGDEFDIVLAGGPPMKSETLPVELFREYGIKPMLLKHLRRNLNPIQDILALVQVYLVIRKFRPQIVHTHSSKPGFAGRIAAWLFGTPSTVHTFHGHVFYGYFNPLTTAVFKHVERKLSGITDRIIAISPSQKEDLCEVYRIASPEKVSMIPIGINPPVITDKPLARRHYGIAPTTLLLGFVGRLETIKNPLMFIHAFARFREKASCPVAAIIIGDGSLKPAMLHLLQKYNIAAYHEIPQGFSDGVAFLSWIYPTSPYFSLLDIYALTSLNEGTPLSIMEAMAHGLPIVATRAGGVGDLIHDESDGVLTPVNDIDAFASALLRLSKDKGLRLKLSANAAHSFKTSFHPQIMINLIRDLYKDMQ